jgi:hypothetical protein
MISDMYNFPHDFSQCALRARGTLAGLHCATEQLLAYQKLLRGQSYTVLILSRRLQIFTTSSKSTQRGYELYTEYCSVVHNLIS